MDMSGSGWSSGCESGWTGYLDESYIQRNDFSDNCHSYRMNFCKDNDEVEEDLSMVSDASSGPQHFQEDGEESYCRSRSQNCYLTSVKSSKKSGDKRSKKSVGKEQMLSKHQNQHSFSSNHLDDTASSPTMTYSKMFDNHSSCNQASVDNYMRFPQGISEAHFQESSSYNHHYGFWQSYLPKDARSAEPSYFRGGR